MTREHTGTIKLNSPGGCNENAQFWFGPTDYIWVIPAETAGNGKDNV